MYKQCSIGLDVAYCVYLIIPNELIVIILEFYI